MQNIITKAAEFAQAAHESIDQRRKYTGEPYIVHPRAVAVTVGSVTDDPVTIAAAWLHDVVEDTPVTIDEVRREFGAEVASLVADLTACRSFPTATGRSEPPSIANTHPRQTHERKQSNWRM